MKNYVLKVRLKDTDIWRTLAIPADCGFFDLHEAIQTAFGWADFYYHEFTAGGTTIADDANEEPDLLPEKFRYEYEANLEFFLKNVKSMTYVYDLEQPWVHEVEIEGVLRGLRHTRAAGRRRQDDRRDSAGRLRDKRGYGRSFEQGDDKRHACRNVCAMKRTALTS